MTFLLLFALFFLPLLAGCGKKEEKSAETKEEEEKKAEEEEEPIAPMLVDVKIGYASFYQHALKLDHWYPVRVEIAAGGLDRRGEIFLRGKNNPLTVRLPYSVASGATKVKQSYCFIQAAEGVGGSDAIQVEIREEESEPVQQTLPYQIMPRGLALQTLVITPERGAFRSLVRRRDPLDYEASQTMIERSIVYGDFDSLPERAEALRSLDSIVINSPDVRAITRERWGAIQEWTAAGGKLLLTGGRNHAFIQKSNLAGAFGLRLADPQPVAFSLAPGPDESSSDEIKILAAFPENVAEGWDEILLGDAQSPWISARRVGAGWFYYCAFDLEEVMIERLARLETAGQLWSPLWDRLLDPSAQPTPLDQIAKRSSAPILTGLEKYFAIRLSSLASIFLFLLVFNMTILPLNWWVCRRLGRRDWSWPVLIILSLAFAGFGYVNGQKRLRKEFQINELTLLRKTGGVDSARARSLAVLYSPGKMLTDLKLGDIAFPADIKEPQQVSFEGQTRLEDVRLFSFTARSHITDFSAPDAGEITIAQPVVVPKSDEPLSGVLTNNTAWPFRRCWIGNGEVFWRHEGEWPPGADLDLAKMMHLAKVEETAAALSWNGLVDLCIKEGYGALADPNLMKETGKNRKGVRMSNTQQDVEEKIDRTIPKDGRFFIWAETDAWRSPLLQSNSTAIRVGRMLFEQELPRSASDWGDEPLSGEDFILTFFQPKKLGTATPTAPTVCDSNHLPSEAWMDLFYIHLTPQVAFDPEKTTLLGLNVQLEIFVVDGAGRRVPGGNRQFPNVNGQWVFKSDYQNETYKLESCPLFLYNQRRGQWEKQEKFKWDSSLYIIDAPKDFFHPETQQIYVCLDARPDFLNYRLFNNGRDTSTTHTGLEINGSQPPQKGVWRVRRFANDYRAYPIRLRVTQLSATVDMKEQ